MLSTKSVLVGCVLLLSNYASATRDITAARFNFDTGKVELQYPDGNDVQKREAYQDYGYGYNDNLVDILRSKKQWKFCKSYINLRPTVKKVVTVTACPGYQKCRPVTITKKKYLGAKTVTEEVPAEEETTTTVQAEKTSTESVHEVSKVTSTKTNTIVVTSTVGTPLETPKPALEGRSIRPPRFLWRYKHAEISSACSQLVKKVIRTKTYTKTKTVPGYARRTTITVLVPRGTVTETMTKKATKTITITTTPVETITEVSTTTEVETTEATSTTTVCPVPSYLGADGVGVEWDDEGSNIEFPDIDFKDPVACCSLCYYNIPNCNVWAAGNEYCFIVAGGSGPGATDKCPNGQGGGILYVTPSTTRGLGGAGPCGGRMRIEE